jgi:uncharacterized protein (DUF488 family)
MGLTIWTIGHSTRSLDEFVALLRQYRLEAIADVRRFPASRRHPQFSQDALEGSLAKAGMEYRWLPSLGGRRVPRPDSRNDGWRNPGFRGYADHLETVEFADGLFELLNLSYGFRTTIMCAEAVWWRCHRGLIADVLCSIGVLTVHILDNTTTVVHPYTAPAHLVAGRLTYERSA